MRLSILGLLLAALIALPSQRSDADILFFDFQGNGGFGLLPGNENPAVSSGASGGETGGGLFYDDVSNLLSIQFNFSDLTGGLADAADGGIHLHQATGDPFTTNGGVIFNLNSGAANVSLGSSGGSIDTDITLTEAQEATLLSSAYYVNIHSGGFGSGELRGNLVLGVPEPASCIVLGLGTIGLAFRRRRK